MRQTDVKQNGHTSECEMATAVSASKESYMVIGESEIVNLA